MLGVPGMALLDRRRHERAVDDPDLADQESLALAPPATLARPLPLAVDLRQLADELDVGCDQDIWVLVAQEVVQGLVEGLSGDVGRVVVSPGQGGTVQLPTSRFMQKVSVVTSIVRLSVISVAEIC